MYDIREMVLDCDKIGKGIKRMPERVNKHDLFEI